MKIAYLICAHRNPRLIKKTTECLACGENSFFVHIDAKFAIEPFQILRGDRVYFLKQRLPVYWGEFSQTEAILQLIREALEASQNDDYFVLLGGSEFPLRSGGYIHKYLAARQGTEFITLLKMPTPGWALSRLNTMRFPSTRPVLRFIFRILAKAGLAQRDYRKHIGPLEPYSGNTWWALSRAACQYILDFDRRDRRLANFLSKTQSSDECYFHTILGNSPLKSRIRRNLLYEEWPSEGSRHHPNLLSAKHVEFFESQAQIPPNDDHGPGEMLFARKFSDDHLELVERISAMIAKKEKLPEQKLA